MFPTNFLANLRAGVIRSQTTPLLGMGPSTRCATDAAHASYRRVKLIRPSGLCDSTGVWHRFFSLRSAWTEMVCSRASVHVSSKSWIVIIRYSRSSVQVPSRYAMTLKVSTSNSIPWIAIYPNTMKKGFLHVVRFFEVFYACTVEGNFLSQSVLCADTILFKNILTMSLARSVNPFAFGLYGVIFWCLIEYRDVMLKITSFRKYCPRSLTNSSGWPNRINSTAHKSNNFYLWVKENNNQ